MHEVALSTQLSHVVRRAAAGRQVTGVHVRIGALRQVVPQTLEYAWGFVIAGTPLEGAQLEVEWVPARVRCEAGHDTLIDASAYLDLRCSSCDAPTRVITGEEFQVVDIEVLTV